MFRRKCTRTARSSCGKSSTWRDCWMICSMSPASRPGKNQPAQLPGRYTRHRPALCGVRRIAGGVVPPRSPRHVSFRTCRRGGRSGADGAGHLQSPDQRDQVHAGGRQALALGRARRRGWGSFTCVTMVLESLPTCFFRACLICLHKRIARWIGRKGGWGSGLTLVKKLVEMHGGSVSAYSDGADCGSEFVVRLGTLTREPLAAADQNRAADAEDYAGRYSWWKMVPMREGALGRLIWIMGARSGDGGGRPRRRRSQAPEIPPGCRAWWISGCLVWTDMKSPGGFARGRRKPLSS